MSAAIGTSKGASKWLAAYWVTLRPYLFFVSGAAGLGGLALGGDVPVLRGAVAFAVLFVAYGLGQALTDTFQLDTDSLSAPWRPPVTGEISVRAVRAVSLVALAASAVILVVLSPWTIVPSALAVLGLVAYTPLKRLPWGGPAWNAAVVALLPVIGRLAAGGRPAEALADPRLWLLGGSVFGSYAVFVILGYLKDVEADRRTRYDTVAVRYGRRPAVLVSAGFAAFGLGESALLVGSLAGGARLALAGLVLWAYGIGATVLAHRLAWKVRRDDEAHPAIAWSVRAFLALHLGEAALLEPSLSVIGIVLLCGFELALAARPARSQI